MKNVIKGIGGTLIALILIYAGYYEIPNYDRRGEIGVIAGEIKCVILREQNKYLFNLHPTVEIIYLDSLRIVHIQEVPKEIVKELRTN